MNLLDLKIRLNSLWLNCWQVDFEFSEVNGNFACLPWEQDPMWKCVHVSYQAVSQQIHTEWLSWLSPLIKLNTVWACRPLGWSDTCDRKRGGLEPKALTQIYVHHVSKTNVTNLLVNLLHFHSVVIRQCLWNSQLWEDMHINQEGKSASYTLVVMFSVYLSGKKWQMNKLWW